MQQTLSLRESTYLNIGRFSQRKIFFLTQSFIITYIMAQNLPLIAVKIDESQQKTNKNAPAQGPINTFLTKYTQRPWGFTISNKKRDELQKLRKQEIERQDKALNSRMIAINERSRHRIHSDIETIYLKSSLHQGVRKQFKKLVKQENHNNKKRLQCLKPTINVKKLEKEWQKKQVIKKNLEKYYSKEGKYRSMSIQINKIYNVPFDEQKIVKYYKERLIGESRVLIKVQQYNHIILISGYLRQKDLLIYLTIQKDKLRHILDENCKGKIQLLGNKLRFDSQTNSLYLIPQNFDDQSKKEYFISSKIVNFEFRKLRAQIKKQHLQIQKQVRSKEQLAKHQGKKKTQVVNQAEKFQQPAEFDKH